MRFLRALCAALGLVLVTVAVPATVATRAVAAPTAAAPDPKVVQVAPAAIDPTGKRDVTADLQAFINRVPNGAELRLRKGARYRSEGTLVLDRRSNLNFNGNGARLFATTTGADDRSHLRITGGSHLVIHDLEIAGDNPYSGVQDAPNRGDLGFQHGIRIEGATDVEIARVRIHDTYGDLMYLGRTEDGQWSERVWIHDSIFARSGRQGIAITAGRDIVIEHNVVTDTRRASFDLEPNGQTWGADNVHIIDNDVGAGRLLFLAAVGGGPVNNVVVAKNRLHGRTMSMQVRGPGLDRRSGFWVVDNSSNTGSKGTLGDFERIDGVVVAGNKQPIVRAGVPTVTAVAVCGLVVTGNNVDPATEAVEGGQPPCGAAPPLTPPAPPDVAGRPVSAAGPTPPSTTTTTTTTTLLAPTGAGTAAERADVDDNGGLGWTDWLRIILAGIVCIGAAAGLVTWAVLSERRARREARRHTSGRPPQH